MKCPLLFQKSVSNLTIFIKRVTLITECGSVCLYPPNPQIEKSEVVCPVSTTKGWGSYVDHFPINAFPFELQLKWKRVFFWWLQWKNIQLAAHLHIFRGQKNINLFIHFQYHWFLFNFIGKGRAFHGLLSSIGNQQKVGIRPPFRYEGF